MKKLFFAALLVSVAASGYAKKKLAITANGESLQALTQVTDNEEPCLYPFGGDNGTALFFCARENKRWYNIYKKDNPFSAAMTQKTSGKNLNYGPVYCAATDKIAFRCQLEGSSTSDIYMMTDGKGKALNQITESSNAFEGSPSFNPEGTLLVYSKVQYSYYRSYNFWGGLFGAANTVVVANSEIWMKNLKTGETTLLGAGACPRFSPDGTKIAYVKYSSDAKSTSIWTMNTDGSEPIQITDAKKGFALNPCWSPDGTKLVFQSSKKDKKDYDIYIIDIDGNNLVQVTINKSYDGMPYWTKDNFLYFVSDRGNTEENLQIWRFKMEE
ncbi:MULTISPECIES: PD40 domain-containing protein [unclassified Prevotella]|uniref:TolB family protein n=1 Tax=unclassified Prevotella TaxID=2638335 RepID=UPI00048A5B89|nr:MULTISPECIES: PD40 domain-containing protein [unclassified Prevotella]